MPNSLKARLKKLKYQGVLSQEDIDRIVILPNAEKAIKNATTMTNEEAIDYFKRSVAEGNTYDERQHNEALDMAIKALEQEPCENCISRELAISTIKSMSNANPSYWHCCDVVDRENLLDEFEELPPVIPHYTDAEIQKMQEIEQAEIQKTYELGKASQPKTGKWILSDGYWRCSDCRGKALLKFDNFGIRTPVYIPVKSNFCPNCGLKMEGSDEE